jgi:hypothetical protein
MEMFLEAEEEKERQVGTINVGIPGNFWMVHSSWFQKIVNHVGWLLSWF